MSENDRKTMYDQLHMVDLSDEDLLKYVGYLWERLKTLDEKAANDPEIERLTTALADYREAHYLAEKREQRSLLKAARRLCQARGIEFVPPAGAKRLD